MNGEKLIRIGPIGESKTCIAGQIIEEINAEVHEQRGDHQIFENTWFTMLTGPYWWPIRKMDVMNYCEEYLVCSQRNEGRIHEQKKNP